MNIFNWQYIISNEINKNYFNKIKLFIKTEELKNKIIFPEKKYIFNAFKLTNFNTIKVVILGQDPYIFKNQADGLCFSVKNKNIITPSLNNIYKEIKNNINNFKYPNHGCLYSWAKQGILLLNRILTVEQKKVLSHSNIGWEIFTENIIKILSDYHEKIIFLLWGKYAREIIPIINIKKHYILTSSHPSPLSANKGFFGCNHFKLVNKILKSNNKKIINWNLNNIK